MTVTPLAPILGRVPSGIFILTLRHEGQETGMLASWVMQAGFDPPMISVAVRQDRYVAEWLTAGSPFVLNVVAAGQKSLLSHFARGFDSDQPAFEGLRIERTPRGAAILLDTIGHLECEPAGHVDSGDHRVFLAKVVDGRLESEDEPMIHVRNNGMKY
jgi:flavin reductase (DIM6/NTAB) family NADH-FMN oxidoreductase RutF